MQHQQAAALDANGDFLLKLTLRHIGRFSGWRNSAKLLNSVLTIAYFDRLGVPRLS